MKPMKRTSIEPDLEVAVSAGFQDCAWGKTWWLPKSMLRKLNPCDTRTWDIAVLLETHDPARVSAIVGQLRRLVTDQIWSPERAQNYYPGSAQERRLVTQLISRNRDLALVLSASTSGYIRQYAIAKIDRLHGPFSLALLLLRHERSCSASPAGSDKCAQIHAGATGRVIRAYGPHHRRVPAYPSGKASVHPALGTTDSNRR